MSWVVVTTRARSITGDHRHKYALDGANSSIVALPEIANAVGDQVELLMDSGVRTGMDIFRAHTLGASGVLLGRAMVYALGSMGQAGVDQLLLILKKELRITMALAGKTAIDELQADDLIMPEG